MYSVGNPHQVLVDGYNHFSLLPVSLYSCWIQIACTACPMMPKPPVEKTPGGTSILDKWLYPSRHQPVLVATTLATPSWVVSWKKIPFENLCFVTQETLKPEWITMIKKWKASILTATFTTGSGPYFPYPSTADEAWHWLKHASYTAGEPSVTPS